MKAISCNVVVNNSWGYVFQPRECESIKKAVEYGKNYSGGFHYRVFSLKGKLLRSGFCNR